MKYEKVLEFARSMRKNPTPAEKFVWDKVRNRQFHGFKFNRQFIIEVTNGQYFIADYYCHEKKLIVELDGSIHDQQKEYDDGRTFELEECGYQVIRFTNYEVLNDWNGVELKLLRVLS